MQNGPVFNYPEVLNTKEYAKNK